MSSVPAYRACHVSINSPGPGSTTAFRAFRFSATSRSDGRACEPQGCARAGAEGLAACTTARTRHSCGARRIRYTLRDRRSDFARDFARHRGNGLPSSRPGSRSRRPGWLCPALRHLYVGREVDLRPEGARHAHQIDRVGGAWKSGFGSSRFVGLAAHRTIGTSLQALSGTMEAVSWSRGGLSKQLPVSRSAGNPASLWVCDRGSTAPILRPSSISAGMNK